MIKRLSDWKGKNSPLFTENISVYIEKPKNKIKNKNLLELISEFIKVIGYKINMQNLFIPIY